MGKRPSVARLDLFLVREDARKVRRVRITAARRAKLFVKISPEWRVRNVGK